MRAPIRLAWDSSKVSNAASANQLTQKTGASSSSASASGSSSASKRIAGTITAGESAKSAGSKPPQVPPPPPPDAPPRDRVGSSEARKTQQTIPASRTGS
ncbi:unnamed protein product, partial [Amoebophrya sp. A25]|eukprot:GSA25T00005720001.1